MDELGGDPETIAEAPQRALEDGGHVEVRNPGGATVSRRRMDKPTAAVFRHVYLTCATLMLE